MISAVSDITKMNSNTCVILNLAIEDSTVPMITERTKITARNAARASQPPSDDGITRFAINAQTVTS